jgi:fructuronate reductase
MWVLEDRFIAGRPRWEAGGAIFTDAVEPYELLKLRLLNGTHSLIAYLGLLAGARHIAEAIVLPEIRQAAEALMREEMLPTLDVPAGVDIEEYMAQLFLRFGNTQIGHRASQVGSDGSLKVPVRITQPVLQHAAAGRVPRLTALLVAAYIRCLATPESYDAATQVAIRDPYQDTLRSLGQRYPASRSLVRAVFDEAGVFAPQLGEITRFVDVVAELHEVLVRRGPHAAATQAATG